MRRAADADRGIVELAGLLLRERNELLEIMDQQVGAAKHEWTTDPRHRNRGEVLFPVIGHALVERGGYRERAIGREVDGIAIRLGAGGEFGPDQSACPGPVVDDDLLPPKRGKLVAQEAREHVTAAPGSVGHDKAHRPRREFLCRGARRYREGRKQQGQSKTPSSRHRILPNDLPEPALSAVACEGSSFERGALPSE